MTRAPETQRHGDEFVARNAWLHLLLGLESHGRRFDALLDAFAPPRDGAPGHPAEARDERLVHFVLGLASLRATLRRALDEAAASSRRASAARRDARPRAGAWLR